MELDIPPSPPPVEATLAERRAKRQAILAKYASTPSTSQSQMPGPTSGPEQGTSSAVQQPPLSIVPVSDPASSQPRSVVGTPGALEVNVTKSSTGLAS
jgi:serine/threonine-protein kinase PRP4